MSQTVTTCEKFVSCSNTTIKVRSTTRDRLAKLGTKAHTYDMIIVELLDQLEVESQWVQFFVNNVIKKEKIILLKN